MPARAFYTQDAKKRTAESIKKVEALTSAEVVVAVRPRAGSYRTTDVYFGFFCACATLGFMWLSPIVFSPLAMPFDTLLAFALGTLVCAQVMPLRRLLTPRRLVEHFLHVEGRAAFYDLGISRTTGRNGILVFVAMLEKRVAMLPDVGVDVASLGGGWSASAAALEAAVQRGDLDGFLSALETLGPVLGEAMPRQEGDVNELPDEPT